MSFSMTRTVSESFTLTHAKYLASKVTTDMLRCQQLYQQPSNTDINDYGTELALLMRDGYVSEYEFGFKIGDYRLLSWHYTVRNSDVTATNDRPGGLPSGVSIANASFFNQLTYSTNWSLLSFEEQQKLKAELPVRRETRDGPKDGLGHWTQDLSYSAGGVSLGRKTFRPYSS
jgi:hypothetical protein